MAARLLLLCLMVTATWPALADSSSPVCPAGRVVTFADVNWESGAFITAVLREILERGFGCATEAIPGNSVTLEQAVADDDVQILAEEWVSRSDIWKKAAAGGRVRAIGHPFEGAVEGWYVPDYLVNGDPARQIAATAPTLRDVAQLTEPAYVRLFQDPEQPALGRFLNCPSGWTCEGVNSAKLDAYGLDGLYVNFRPGTGPAMEAAITAAYLQGRPLLFYAWSPSTLAGKLKLFRLTEPPYSASCWDDLTSTRGTHRQGCAAPPADVAYGVSTRFADSAPDIMGFLQKATFPLAELNSNLVAMADRHGSAAAQAIDFLRRRPDLWRTWLAPSVAERVAATLAEPPRRADASAKTSFPSAWVVSIRQPVNDALARLVKDHGAGFRLVAGLLLDLIVAVDRGVAWLPWWLLIAVFMGLTWIGVEVGTRRLVLTAVVGTLLFGLGLLGLWALMLQTLTLMLLASLVAVGIGLPLGIAAAKWRAVRATLMPMLDVMQTMPSFVYLIPALMLFGLGKVPALMATIIYAVPPMIRLTALGIEHVDPDLREAATAFGVTPLQMLLSVELPLARPSIMAGVNQTIMLALSMVVLASMIGARGLGEQVLNGIQTLDIGQGLEAGIGIVILAFVLDRITQGFGAPRRPR